MKDTLLHACCAPCSSAILEKMDKDGIEPVIFFSNSNIVPKEEYDKRLAELYRYAARYGFEVVEDEYDHEAWRKAVKGLENEPERGARCLQCFKFRLERAAEFARKRGLGRLTTTLASSRWKRLDQVDEAGEEACSQNEGVQWWSVNWRKGGLQERRNALIKELGFYNQLYCGCEFSLRPAADRHSDDDGQSSDGAK
ncbi:MAG: epoxyqueuosine reductase QueH [Bacteroidales bacterium]|jgi:hypothetical protein|nr:epoxyqueuosine reductase QueH [Bacteroidales bacterium]